MNWNKFTLMLDGQPYEVERRGDLMIVNGIEFPCQVKDGQVVISGTPHTVNLSGSAAEVDGIWYAIKARGIEKPKVPGNKPQTSRQSQTEAGTVTAVMPGLIIKVFKAEGDVVKAGETILILEAMKMQNEIRAGHDCTVKEVHVRPGQTVEKGERLMSLKG
jgi:biotin carboxyl carrier protein